MHKWLREAKKESSSCPTNRVGYVESSREKHFDHVLHHLSSTAVKEHVLATAQHGGKNNVAFKNTIFRRSSGVVNAPFSGAISDALQAPYQASVRHRLQASFRRSIGSHSGAFQAPYQAPFKRYY
ncbi:hypothetical protein CK203_114937 [Vitis vinifera]|uniref:Uncharacterized protein n=1 Tax=Vitis vinifera TaxID=29760 RepID=A0A438FDA7_VITVI|nr:hypothetical protein CK203_114937 [Vitis vinifera]